MVDQAHIVAIAVREAYRGLGLGELLLAEAVDLAMENHQESVTLEVRKSNLVAQGLYEKYRFLKVGVRKRYYSDNHEDAIIMTTPPIQDDPYREHLEYLRDALAAPLGRRQRSRQLELVGPDTHALRTERTRVQLAHMTSSLEPRVMSNSMAAIGHAA